MKTSWWSTIHFRFCFYLWFRARALFDDIITCSLHNMKKNGSVLLSCSVSHNNIFTEFMNNKVVMTMGNCINVQASKQTVRDCPVMPGNVGVLAVCAQFFLKLFVRMELRAQNQSIVSRGMSVCTATDACSMIRIKSSVMELEEEWEGRPSTAYMKRQERNWLTSIPDRVSCCVW